MPIFAYMNIFNMRTMILCHRNEKINQKFVLLKVASDKKLTVAIYGCAMFSFPSYIYSWNNEQIDRDIALLLKITLICVITIGVVLNHSTS
jgi:hypothetical protein